MGGMPDGVGARWKDRPPHRSRPGNGIAATGRGNSSTFPGVAVTHCHARSLSRRPRLDFNGGKLAFFGEILAWAELSHAVVDSLKSVWALPR